MTDTIVALSSGALPAGIGVLRLSGPAAFAAATTLCRALPEPRRAALRVLRDHAGEMLDHAVVITFPGPASFTGEDIVELHCHGSRAVVRAVESALVTIAGVRPAEPGEFTRRALMAGRIDLTQAEGLGDLLAAETEAQRRAALRSTDGVLRQRIERWSEETVRLSALVEAIIDHEDDEADVGGAAGLLETIRGDALALAQELEELASAPPAERLKEGIRVVLAGPPNSGKSTLFNALIGRDAAIVSPLAGTTRDRIEAPVERFGVAWLFIDTAGLADRTDDPIERIGIERSLATMAACDIILWLGDDGCDTKSSIRIHARNDEPGREICPAGSIAVSAANGVGLEEVWQALTNKAHGFLPLPDSITLNTRQQTICCGAAEFLLGAARESDILLMAESFRQTRRAYDSLTGRADTEAVLDALFDTFCIGK